jgi:hypothetical protein
MGDNIAQFFLGIPPYVREQMDFSLSSMDILERWLLQRYTSYEILINSEDDLLIDSAGCYVGETFRMLLGGEWVIELEDQKYAYLGIPGIDHFDVPEKERSPVYPRTWITTSVHRRTEHFIRKRFETWLSFRL